MNSMGIFKKITYPITSRYEKITYKDTDIEQMKDFFYSSKISKNKLASSIRNHPLVSDGPKELADFFIEHADKFLGSETCLNIGIGYDVPPDWLTLFHDIFHYSRVGNLEAWKPYMWHWKYHQIYPVWFGDVKDITKFLPPKSIDTLIWAHGPEHVKSEDFPDIYRSIKKVVRKHILFITPWGDAYDYQKEINHNPYEFHQVHGPDESIYANTNVKFLTWGKKNTLTAGLLAYEFLDESNDHV